MTLCEVALGSPYEVLTGKAMKKPPNGYHSVFALGKYTPNEKYRMDFTNVAGNFALMNDDLYDKNSLKFEAGSLGERRNLEGKERVEGSELNYNEYIVYDIAQVYIL